MLLLTSSLTTGQELFIVEETLYCTGFSYHKVMILLKQALLGKRIQNAEQMFPRAGGESTAKTFHKPPGPRDLSK